MVRNYVERGHKSIKLEGGLGLALGGNVSFEVKFDKQTNETSVTACLSVSETLGQAYGKLVLTENAPGGVTDSLELSAGVSVSGFIGVGALAGEFSYDVLLDKFEKTYGISKTSAIVGIGIRDDASISACVEVNPTGLLRSGESILKNLFGDDKAMNERSGSSMAKESGMYHLLDPENTRNFFDKMNESLNETMDSVREAKDNLNEGKESRMGELSDRASREPRENHLAGKLSS